MEEGRVCDQEVRSRNKREKCCDRQEASVTGFQPAENVRQPCYGRLAQQTPS